MFFMKNYIWLTNIFKKPNSLALKGTCPALHKLNTKKMNVLLHNLTFFIFVV